MQVEPHSGLESEPCALIPHVITQKIHKNSKNFIWHIMSNVNANEALTVSGYLNSLKEKQTLLLLYGSV